MMRLKIRFEGVGLSLRRQLRQDTSLHTLLDTIILPFVASVPGAEGSWGLMYKDEEGDLVAITSEEEWEEGVQVLSSVAASSEQQAGPLLHLMAIPKHQIMDVACGRLSLPLAPAPQVVHEKKQEEKKEEEKEEPAEEVVEEHECSTSRCEMVRVVLGLPVPTKEGFIEVIRRSRKPLILSVDAQNLSALCGRVYCDRVLSPRGPCTVLGFDSNNIVWFLVDGDGGASNWGKKPKSYMLANFPRLSKDTDSAISEMLESTPAPSTEVSPTVEGELSASKGECKEVEKTEEGGAPALSTSEVEIIVDHLASMGFHRDLSRFVLKASNWNEEAALETLLKMFSK